MTKTTILIAESNLEESIKLQEICKSWGDSFQVINTECGTEALEICKTTKPNLIISGFALKGTDGVSLCEDVKGVNENVMVIIVASAFSDATVKRMTECGVDYYMLRPFTEKALRNQVQFLLGLKSEEATVEPETQAAKVVGSFPAIANKQLEERISNIFITMGIPAHIKGYHFLREAIKTIVGNPAMIGGITKELYPAIARTFDTTSSKVERAIRHAIEVGWNRGRINQINEIFKVRAFDQKDRPTNGEFIALVADKLLLEGVG
ncbi:MAG: sporulation transcription factor Spo0A [Firmicutes bacterium]|nr:sporulation transcription factor Spo0A [Bacillota bacterium]